MPKATKPTSRRASVRETPQSMGKPATLLKWVGGTTAVLSLVFGLRQLAGLISDARERRHHVAELIATGRLQQDARDYESAWKSLGKAAELGASEPSVRTAQEDLAMAWLDNIRGDQGPTPFIAIVDMLGPVMSRGAVSAEGSRKADLLAHLGWADFLRWRDGQRGLDPAGRYRLALAADSQDVYAHAMLAHWMLWNGGAVEEANQHFARALRSGRERPYVRRLQLAALANRSDGPGEAEMIRVANDMRKSNDSMGPHDRDRMWDSYYTRFVASAGAASTEQVAAAPPAEQLATYRWVFANSGYVESKGFLYQYILARLQDAAGQDADALATYRSVRSTLPAHEVSRIRGRVDSAVGRLSKRP
ncbi:MAG: hypothetical protein ACJ8DC_10545 [Gemmatimonadales bacterium]